MMTNTSISQILASWLMTPYTMILVGLLCQPISLLTSPSLKVLLDKILQTMFDLSTCGVHLTPLPMTLSIFGCSNEHLQVKLLSGMLIRPLPLIPPLRLLPGLFYLTSSFLFVMTLVLNFWLISVNFLWPAYPIMSNNGGEERAYVEPLPLKTMSTWTSFLDLSCLLSAKMSHRISLKPKKLLSKLR